MNPTRNRLHPFLRCELLLTILLSLTAAMGCGDDEDGGMQPGPNPNLVVQLQPVYEQVPFDFPVGLVNAGNGSGRLYVVEQSGSIRYLDPADSTHAPVFVDLKDRVDYAPFGETGLLGLAFHPTYPTPRWIYIYYTYMEGGTRYGRLTRLTVDPSGDSADPASEVELLRVEQPFANHNGGGLCFGEGTELYLALGDGGGGGDPNDNAQDPTTPLGSILRLDVGVNPSTPPYHGIPADNPFVGNTEGYREEIFAYGLRNPWRISFDPVEGELWAGDVGQNTWEEVDRIVNGGNYGWDCREGAHPYLPPPGSSSPRCVTTGPSSPTPLPYIDPITEYDHSNNDRSITGGFVYRGHAVPPLSGRYVFADYGSGRIWACSRDGSEVDPLLDAPFSISSFGVDEDGELYVLEYGVRGAVHRFIAVEMEPGP